MKAATYEPSAGALATWVATKPRNAWIADLYTITLIGGGTVLRYTTSDINITIPYGSPLTYDSTSALFDTFQSKSTAHWKCGLDVDTWTVIMAPRPSAVIGSRSWLSAVVSGILDGATVAVDRAFWDGPPLGGGVLRGVVNIFTGRIAETFITRSGCQLNINSHLELLNTAVPRTLAQATCRWTLFSSGCGLTAATYASSGTVSAGSTTSSILSTISAPIGSGTFTLGRIKFTSGVNSGISRSVRAWTAGSPGTLSLIAPLPSAPTAGDTFTAYPGCDKSMATCLTFANTANFGGMPFIPAPESAT